MPMLNVVRYDCSSEDAAAEVRECLAAFAAHQLEAPNPGTSVYHFSRPNPEKKPLQMQFVEVYKTDTDFWKHLDAGPEIQARVFKMFDEKNRSYREWRIYYDGQQSPEEEKKVRDSIVPMGASMDCKRLAGFLFNDKMPKDAVPNAKDFLLLSGRFTIKGNASLAKAIQAVEKAAEKAKGNPHGVLTLFAGGPTPEENPMAVELIISALGPAMASMAEAVGGALGGLSKDAEVVIYGKDGSDASASAWKVALDKSNCDLVLVRRAESEIGYAAHPQLEKAL